MASIGNPQRPHHAERPLPSPDFGISRSRETVGQQDNVNGDRLRSLPRLWNALRVSPRSHSKSARQPGTAQAHLAGHIALSQPPKSHMRHRQRYLSSTPTRTRCDVPLQLIQDQVRLSTPASATANRDAPPSIAVNAVDLATSAAPTGHSRWPSWPRSSRSQRRRSRYLPSKLRSRT